jgi:hypothetical protein
MTTSKKILAALPLVLLVIFSLSPAFAFADSNQPNYQVWNPTILKGPLVTCVGVQNPSSAGTGGGKPLPQCTSICDLVSTIANVIYFSIGVVIWILVPIMVAWAGILFLISRGNSERTGQARKMITGVVMGLLICLCAYLIISIFVTALNLGSQIGGFGGSAACTAS